jgi:tRNA A37 threonylcarbamoyladenosine modification protein TsaB
MRINTVIETDDGGVDLTATLAPNQVHLLLEMALTILINNGLQLVDTKNVVVVEGPEGIQ